MSPGSRETHLSAGTIIGRDPTCDAVLEGEEVSRRHVAIRIEGPVLIARDLGSRNGIYVNGQRVPEGPLEAGDVFRCGDWVGLVSSTREVEGRDRSGGRTGFCEVAPGLFGGAALAAALEPARRLKGDLPVLIQGETGTGKEDTARAVHGWSRRTGDFVALNCATLPADLAEAELFGYRRGAFTGADRATPGLFRAAEGGSLFLDEVLELPVGLQAKLLRAIETKRIRPLGEAQDVAVDVRLIAAAQEPLRKAVADGRFRADLHARLEGLTVVLPPLRDRREDIVPLFSRFVDEKARAAGVTPPRIEARLLESLLLHDWPLNVRELLLLAARLVGVHGPEGLLKRSQLPEHMLAPSGADDDESAASSGSSRSFKRARKKVDDQDELAALMQALQSERTVAKAAAAIGVSRARAYRLISARKDS